MKRQPKADEEQEEKGEKNVLHRQQGPCMGGHSVIMSNGNAKSSAPTYTKQGRNSLY